MIDELKLQVALGSISLQFFLDNYDKIYEFLKICTDQQFCCDLYNTLDFIVFDKQIFLRSDDNIATKMWNLRRLAYDKIWALDSKFKNNRD